MSLPGLAGLPDSTDPIVQSQNKELIEQLAPKQAIISKAVIIQDGQAVCYIDFTDKGNQTDLLPHFSKTIPENFRSSISIHNLRACNEIEKENYSYLKDHFILEGTQTALIPFLAWAGGSALVGGGIGCLVGRLAKKEWVRWAFGGTALASFFGFFGMHIAHAETGRMFPAAYPIVLISTMGMTGGFVGAVICHEHEGDSHEHEGDSKVAHFFEEVEED